MKKKLNLADFCGAIFDFDDTILDNQTNSSDGNDGHNLHTRSRYDAARSVGRRKNIAALTNYPAEINKIAFCNAPAHSVEGAYWWALQQIGVIDAAADFDKDHPLIQELVSEKSLFYETLLRDEAVEVAGARDFIQHLYKNGYADKLAIASTGRRVDILTFFDAHGFRQFFPDQNIFAKEDVTTTKPNPESFLKALASIGVDRGDAHKILAFEDDPRGIEAAKAAGLFTCGVATRFSEEDLLKLPTPPDLVFQNYLEL